jgi:hypothetical protein
MAQKVAVPQHGGIGGGRKKAKKGNIKFEQLS